MPSQAPLSIEPLQPMPDVAIHAAPSARVLDWVGMERMALPIRLTGDDGGILHVPASVDVAVDLRDADARGIHMSRLYLLVQQALANEAPSAPALRHLLDACVASQSGLSTRARLVLRYDHLLLRPALVSAHSGWKHYPVTLEAELRDAGTGQGGGAQLGLALAFSVDYSSTCPASAALSRQLNAQRFSGDFAGVRALSNAVVAEWLASERGLAATPHAQRSRAEVRVELTPACEQVPLRDLVDAVEGALGTPVQTAVKREDEQAFAEANAANLMFCEDAARRVAAALSEDARVSAWHVRVAHFESLHAHDAVASVSGRNP